MNLWRGREIVTTDTALKEKMFNTTKTRATMHQHKV